ncbi:MAG: hypothetical protein F4Y80_05925 [Caldilineaceae bacterium SB0665_bin_21]|nr:hypothetical protein [Caldilineaceae bacterium SB0665_bin_21]MYC63171.1 hypothetical protein [Caldilineaceae bacterium SB0661_bin_34]
MEPWFGITFLDVLRALFLASTSVVAILAFALGVYALYFNFRSAVARRFAYLSLSVLVVYAVDVALYRVTDLDSAEFWLRLQWVGIGVLPAVYYRFATGVLQATNLHSPARSWAGWVLMGTCLVLVALTQFGDLVVRNVTASEAFHFFAPGPLFWLFAGMFALVLALSVRDLLLTRGRSLTQRSRRRVHILLLGFAGPVLGCFPFLLLLGPQLGEFTHLIYTVSLLVNGTVSLLLTLMVMAVAFYGVHLPDRVVRYRLMRYLIRGPAIAICVIIAIQVVPRVESLLGIPRDLILFYVVTAVIVVGQLAVSATKRLMDYVIYRDDIREISLYRELERRLLTHSDVREFLENHLTAACEFLGAGRGFVASLAADSLVVEAVVGTEMDPELVMPAAAWREVLRMALVHDQDRHEAFTVPGVDFRMWPLRGAAGPRRETILLGVIGVAAEQGPLPLAAAAARVFASMRSKMAEALTDHRIQANVISGLQPIMSEIDRIQHLRSQLPYPIEAAGRTSPLWTETEILNPEFPAWVRDALRDLWGGPRLSGSPLMKLKVVATYLERTNGNAQQALRLVMGDAIERMRPDEGTELGHLDSLLYRILDMRFIQGRKVRDIAGKLAMSESDLYRKQRIAIRQVAGIIQEMEQSELDKEVETVGQNRIGT